MNKNKKELAKEITEKLINADKLENIEEMVKNNIIEFDLNKVRYRIRKPTIAERGEVRKYKNVKYMKLLNDDNCLFREQLIERLEKKGKSITKLIEQMAKIQQQIEKLQLKLAEYGKQKEKDNKIITDYELKIFELMQERNLISMEKNELLSGSIEDEISEFTSTYYCYLLLERKEKDKWIRTFATYDDFINCKDNKLMGFAGHYLGLLLFSVGEENE